MLRTLYAYGSEDLKQVLSRFNIPNTSSVEITSFKALSPDSFIWRLRIGTDIYYLYAEDYIPSLEHVESKIKDVSGQRGVFIETNDQKEFEAQTPVRHAITYKKPNDYDTQMIRYAVDSGYDLVFLYKMRSGNGES